MIYPRNIIPVYLVIKFVYSVDEHNILFPVLDKNE